MATHAGSCHCGRIAFTVEGDFDKAIDCNCSMCRRRGSLLAFVPREALVLQTPESDIGTYAFNSRALQHQSSTATRSASVRGSATASGGFGYSRRKARTTSRNDFP